MIETPFHFLDTLQILLKSFSPPFRSLVHTLTHFTLFNVFTLFETLKNNNNFRRVCLINEKNLNVWTFLRNLQTLSCSFLIKIQKNANSAVIR